MYKNAIDPGKSVSFGMKDIDIGGQNQYAMCTVQVLTWNKNVILLYDLLNGLLFNKSMEISLYWIV